MKLAPQNGGYVRDISLETMDGGACVAVWVEENEARRIVWSTIQKDHPRRAGSTEAVHGHPTMPCAVPGHIIWAEQGEDKSCLMDLPVSEDWSPFGEPHTIPVERSGRIDHPAVALDGNGDICVLSELWDTGGSALVLLRNHSGNWHTEDLPASGYCVRPRLESTPDGLLATWDCYRRSSFRVCLGEKGSGSWSVSELPNPDGTRETLSEAAVGPDGTRYVARCRERPVKLRGGACSFCSQVAVSKSVHGDRKWREIGAVNIDHGLNPWLGPYCGRRRFPHLLPDEAGVWVLWEEKIHPRSREVPGGRLCAVHLRPTGERGKPVIALDDESHFVVARGGAPGNCPVISRGRPELFVEQYPARLHWIDLGEEHPEREPTPDTNEGAAEFRPVCWPETDRPRKGGRQLFFGDPHLHSRMSSDLPGEQDESYLFARDFARMDFVAFTENDYHHYAEQLPEVDWIRSRRNAEVFNRPGEFSTFQSWEFTGMAHPDFKKGRESHRCVLFPGSNAELLPWYDGRRVLTSSDLAEHFRGREVLLHHHHPQAYDITDDSVERNIEICSGWWNCMRIPEFVENLHRMLNEGHHLGFLGASDNHERNPGLAGALTGVWAEENTRESLFEAMRARRMFATTGLRPTVWFEVSDTPMGSNGQTARHPTVDLQARCDVPITLVRIVRNGKEVHVERPGTRKATVNWTDRRSNAGKHWYYAHLQFEIDNPEIDWSNPMPLPWNVAPARGRDAWTSPVWMEYRPRGDVKQ